MRRHLYSHTAVVGAGQLGAQTVSAVMFLVLARELGVAAFGHLAAAYGTAMLGSVVVEFGASLFWTRKIAAGEGVENFAVAFRSRTACCVPVLAATGVLGLSVPWGPTVFWGSFLAVIIALGRISTCPARAGNKLLRLALVTVAEKVVLLGLILVRPVADAADFLALACAAATLAVVVNLGMVREVGASTFLPWRRPWTHPFRGTAHLGLGAVAIGTQTLDAMVLQLSAGSQVAGIYAAVGRWTQPMGLLAAAVTQGNYADMARESDHRTAMVLLRRSGVLLAVSCVPIVLVAIFAGPLVAVLLGPAFAGSAGVLRVLALACMVSVLNAPLVAFLQARGEEKRTARALLVMIPGQMAAMAVVAHEAGASAAALVVLAAQVLLCLVLLRTLQRLHVREGSSVVDDRSSVVS